MEMVAINIFIVGSVFYFFQKKKFEKKIEAMKTQNEELIIKKKLVLMDLEELKNKMNLINKSLLDVEIEALEQKNELEYIAARSGLNKMDDGILFNYIKNEQKFSRTLLSNWLPYGMQLGKLDLLKKLKAHFK